MRPPPGWPCLRRRLRQEQQPLVGLLGTRLRHGRPGAERGGREAGGRRRAGSGPSAAAHGAAGRHSPLRGRGSCHGPAHARGTGTPPPPPLPALKGPRRRAAPAEVPPRPRAAQPSPDQPVCLRGSRRRAPRAPKPSPGQPPVTGPHLSLQGTWPHGRIVLGNRRARPAKSPPLVSRGGGGGVLPLLLPPALGQHRVLRAAGVSLQAV